LVAHLIGPLKVAAIPGVLALGHQRLHLVVGQRGIGRADGERFGLKGQQVEAEDEVETADKPERVQGRGRRAGQQGR
jgi:hypothetical protein